MQAKKIYKSELVSENQGLRNDINKCTREIEKLTE